MFRWLVFAEYKRARAELKKRSSDTLRLQKKARKACGGSLSASNTVGGGDLAKRLESGLADMTERRQMLENTEKNAVRAALLEERARFCTLAVLLRPVIVSGAEFPSWLRFSDLNPHFGSEFPTRSQISN